MILLYMLIKRWPLLASCRIDKAQCEKNWICLKYKDLRTRGEILVDLDFADGIVLLTEYAEGMQILTDRLKVMANKLGLCILSEKTKQMNVNLKKSSQTGLIIHDPQVYFSWIFSQKRAIYRKGCLIKNMHSLRDIP